MRHFAQHHRHRRHDHAAMALCHRAPDLAHRRLDRRQRDDALGNEARADGGPFLDQPVVVRLHARELERGILEAAEGLACTPGDRPDTAPNSRRRRRPSPRGARWACTRWRARPPSAAARARDRASRRPRARRRANRPASRRRPSARCRRPARSTCGMRSPHFAFDMRAVQTSGCSCTWSSALMNPYLSSMSGSYARA